MISKKSIESRIENLEKFIEQFGSTVETSLELQSQSKKELEEWLAELSESVIQLNEERPKIIEEINELRSLLMKNCRMQVDMVERIQVLEKTKN
jgi:F0F1-type ATP synthase membrane subunit b/b'